MSWVDNKLFDFQVNFVSDAGNNYLVLSKAGFSRKQLIEFQVEMIANNDLTGIVKLEAREKNAEIKLYYNISGQLCLAEYLRQQKLGKVELITILEGILTILLEGNKYFFSEQSFVIDENYIYISPRSGNVAVLYLPVDIQQELTKTFKSFLINLISHNANNENQGDFAQKMLKTIQSESFNLPEFRRQLKELKSAEAFQCIPLSPERIQEYITIVPPNNKKPAAPQSSKSKGNSGLVVLSMVGLIALLVTIFSKLY